jgi:hypothetical protein
MICKVIYKNVNFYIHKNQVIQQLEIRVERSITAPNDKNNFKKGVEALVQVLGKRALTESQRR